MTAASFISNGSAAFSDGCEIAGIPVAVFFVGLYPWYTDERWWNLMVAVIFIIRCSRL